MKKTITFSLCLGFLFAPAKTFSNDTVNNIVGSVVVLLTIGAAGAYYWYNFTHSDDTITQAEDDSIQKKESEIKDTKPESELSHPHLSTGKIVHHDENKKEATIISQELQKRALFSPQLKTVIAGISGTVGLIALGKIAFNWYKQYKEKQKTEQENADKEYNEIERLLS